MFRRISLRIALLFTAFVTLLLLINGAAFIFADTRVAERSRDARLRLDSRRLVEQIPGTFSGIDIVLPPRQRERVRIADASGTVLFAGGMFNSVIFDPEAEEFTDTSVQGEEFRFVTTPVISDGRLIGFVQIGTPPDMRTRDLAGRGFLLLVTSALISVLAFLVGLLYARKILKPAEETMQRLEQFTQDASHELRTPLAVLGSSLDVALKTKNYKEGIDSAKDDLKQILVLVERLLELARLDTFTLEKQAVDLSQLMSETVEKFSHLAGEQSMTLESDILPGISVQADPTLLRQILGNLLSNAIKFNNKGGTITVRLTKKSLTISDTGIGISEADLPHLFDRFYQADASRSRGGLGLGLALVKRITNLHGWTITVESTAGKGTRFTVKLP